MHPNDFRISDMGPDNDPSYDAIRPAVAYNNVGNEFLIVWQGTEMPGDREIYGQRVTASGGAAGANDFRISTVGVDGDLAKFAGAPDVAFKAADSSYLVVWRANPSGASQIYAQSLESTGNEFGSNDFALSDMASFSDFPAIAYSATSDKCLTVWRGGDDILPLITIEYEIFGQRYKPGAPPDLPHEIYLPVIVRK